MADETLGGGMWRTQAAGSVGGLSELAALVHAEEAGRLVAVYGELMERAGGAPPRKADFDPTALRGAISSAVLYDVSDPQHVIFRIVGERMQSHFRVNPVGRCYLEFVPEARREHALAAFRRCAETPCGMLSRTGRSSKAA
ncbi:MAG: hypothetical protein NXI21_07475 [Alphaproteobacteria bacterium]|nr:hypothetical protein [Alphaproteobacteria bacterium]